jgi:CheY-like chemotaxis protein
MGYGKILIVDDSATSRMIIRRCFEIAGFRDSTFYEAEDGVQAISFLRDNRVDLVLSDVRMPKMDGGTFVRKLSMSETTRAIPVVMITSMSNEQLEAELKQSGVKAVIRKPISPQKVVEVMGGAA